MRRLLAASAVQASSSVRGMAVGASTDAVGGMQSLLVNPNEKFYISIAHTDADIDRTLEIADEAFAAIQA